MRLIDNAGEIWHRLWSVRLSVCASMLGAAAAALPFAAPANPTWRFALLVAVVTLAASLVSLAAAASRLVAQPKLRRDRHG